MKRQLFGLLALSTTAVGVLGLCAPDTAEAAPTSYSIYCRGGQGATDLNIHWAGVAVEKQFLHGTGPYDAAELRPGECAWPDRAMNASEPYRLFYSRKVVGRDQISVRGNMQLGLWRLGKNSVAEQATPKDLVAINRLQSPNFIVELRVASTTFSRKLRNGEPREVKALKVTDVGVVRQIGQSNRG